ncbi:MAG: hypothetical protein CMH21_03910 [Methylophaga sp.]|jgi:uncharacterized protein (DUF302 family)|uniref:DUF302 domain-containing protein n=1 Tax=Methylophaga sp. UBA1464 TaxID=1946866 RepID=UPI000C8DC05F|nr:DUF302 domain-containing protein [Methylophaga sp. UBA1464]MAK67323.1 hypothetical protein [Methylophaga sp.]MAY16864.1 hypothetical protein [Methylophaga sp.]HAO25661.1 hypothetical protein [Methylophaga sp.]HCD06486.1 hypothetical protein [Methylophaga sp.]|tara:strand:- start:1123 stop:1584 length:462 start_codon:yes stop_codon:yes gene_type:complete
MTLFTHLKIPGILISSLFFIIACQPANTNRIIEINSPYSYQETLENLNIAISEHNYRIIHKSDIGSAIRERGDEDFPLSIVISFCNITYAKEMMLINEQLINDMPCIMTVRESSNGVIIGTRLMDENVADKKQAEFAARINDNLKKIMEATVL